jgi:hypothetical protein
MRVLGIRRLVGHYLVQWMDDKERRSDPEISDNLLE